MDNDIEKLLNDSSGKKVKSNNIVNVSIISEFYTAQKRKFSSKDFFSKCDQITFIEEILNGKLHFLFTFPSMFISSFL